MLCNVVSLYLGETWRYTHTGIDVSISLLNWTWWAIYWIEMCNKITAVTAVKELLVTVTDTYLLNEFRLEFPIQMIITMLKKQETIHVLIQ